MTIRDFLGMPDKKILKIKEEISKQANAAYYTYFVFDQLKNRMGNLELATMKGRILGKLEKLSNLNKEYSEAVPSLGNHQDYENIKDCYSRLVDKIDKLMIGRYEKQK